MQIFHLHCFSICVVLFYFYEVSTNTNLILIPEIRQNIYNNLSELIFKHYTCDYRYHFDSKTKYLIDKIISFKSASLTINYDLSNNHMKTNRETLHIVALETLDAFFVNNINYRINDDVVVVLLNGTNQLNDTLNFSQDKIFRNIIIVTIEQEQIKSVNELCYFCGRKSGKLNKFVVNSNLEQTILSSESFTNYYGHSFKVALIEYYPIIWCKEYGDEITVDGLDYKICKHVEGIEYNLLKIIRSVLNFTTLCIIKKSENDYLEMINQTGQGIHDIGMGGITVTPERLELADFTSSHRYESFNCLFFSNDFSWFQLIGFLKPLHKYLWVCLLLACLSISLFLYLFTFFAKLDRPRMSALKIFLKLSYLLIDQQIPIKDLSKLKRISLALLIAWCLVGLNLNIAYKSKLLSTLVNPINNEPQDLIELVEKDFQFVLNTFYDEVPVALIERAQNHTTRRDILSTVVRIDETCDEFDYTAAHRAAMIDEYTALQFQVRRTCSKEIAKHLADIPRAMVTRSLISLGHGLVLRKECQFKQSFDRVIHRIASAGLMVKWERDASSTMESNIKTFPYSFYKTKNDGGKLSFRLNSLMSPFFVYIVGNFLAILTFVIERLTLHFYCRCRRCITGGSVNEHIMKSNVIKIKKPLSVLKIKNVWGRH